MSSKTQTEFDEEWAEQKAIWKSEKEKPIIKSLKTSDMKKPKRKRKSDIKRGRLIGRRKGSALRANVFRGF